MTVREVHFEITDRCNAGCPQCVRTNPDGCVPWDYISNKACSLEDFMRFSPPHFLKQLEHIYFCGNFGDPVMAPDLLKIIRYCFLSNPKLSLKVHSNCGLKTPAWWRELAALVSGKRFKLVASIDGITPEVSALYRVRVNFDRAMENVKAFINDGGVAEWRFVVFGHNEHQVKDAQSLAAKMGFAGFKSHSSTRFFGQLDFPYTTSGKSFSLTPSSTYTKKFADQKTIPVNQLLTSPREKFKISCSALATRSVFIDQDGNITPCCHIGIRLYTFNRGVADVNQDGEIYDIFEKFDMRRVSARHRPFDDALNGCLEFNRFLQQSWAAHGPFVCRMICGKAPAPHAEAPTVRSLPTV